MGDAKIAERGIDTRFQPGHARLGGRPRKKVISSEYEQLMGEELPEKERKALGHPKGTTWGRAIAVSRGRAALTLRGTLDAKEIREACEGKAPMIQFNQLNAPPVFEVVYADLPPHVREQRQREREAALRESEPIDVDVESTDIAPETPEQSE
jgi:hypothetical protein